MTQPILFSKRFGAWVTALTDRYQTDPFYKVYVQVGLLQVVLTILLAIFLLGTYHYLQVHVPDQLIFGGNDPDTVREIVRARREHLFIWLFFGFFMLTLGFSAFTAKLALKPSRNTLAFQKRFIGNIAHEIRTPLAIIKTSTEVALFDPALAKPIRETMEQTIEELNRISETINNLLSFDSLMRPKAMQFDPVDLSQIAATVCDRHQELAKSRGIALVTDLMDGAIVNGNAVALDQVITNLTKNAINYTPQHKDGKVTIEVNRAQNGSVYVAVIDTGIGIDQKDLYHIFEPFYRADTSRARGIGTGTSGLGLAIVNEIIRLHHGTITLRSAIGHGTTIKITFPSYKDHRMELPLMSPSGSPHEATLDFS